MAKRATKKTTKPAAETATEETAPVSRSPVAEKEIALTKSALKKIGKEMLEARGRAPFSIPKKADEIISRATTLNGERDAGEMELSALLHAAQEMNLHTVEGFANLSELAQERMGISGSKARTLANNYGYFTSLGLEPKLFSGKNAISYSKFKELIKGIKAEVITSRNILEWLPLLTNSGPTALSLRDIQKRVKETLMKAGGEDGEDQVTMKKFAFEVPSDQLETYADILETLKESLGVDSDSAAILRSLQSTASANIEGAEGQVAYMGLSGLRKMMAGTAPVIPVIIPDDENVTFDTVGVPVVPTLYFAMKATNPEACFATSKEAAAKALGVASSSVREMNFVVAEDIREGLPKFQGQFKTGDVDLDEVEEVDPEALVEEEVEEVDAYEIDESWVGTTVTATYKDEEIEGEIVKVNEDDGIVSIKVPGARGRPKNVAFADVIDVVEDEAEELTLEDEEEVEEETPETAAEETEELSFDDEEDEEETPEAPEFDIEDTQAMSNYVVAIGTALKKTKDAANIKRAKAIQKHFEVLQKEYAGQENAKGLIFSELVTFAHREAVEAGIDITALA